MSDPEAEADPNDNDGINLEEEVEGVEEVNCADEDGDNAADNTVELDILPDLPPLHPTNTGNDATSTNTNTNAEAIANNDDDDNGSNYSVDETLNSGDEIGNDNVEAAAGGAEPSSDTDDGAHDVVADTNLKGWFLRHALPYTDGVCISLDDLGVECVEQLKILPREYFLAMFEGEKFVVKEIAKLAFNKLNEVPIDLKKCAVGLIEEESASVTAILQSKKVSALVPATYYSKKVSALSSATYNSKMGAASKSTPNKKGRSAKSKVGEACAARRRKQMEQENDPLLEGIIRLWSKTGHQNNLLRINVCNALRGGYSKSKIARSVRARVFGDWDGVASNCAILKKILATLVRIHNDIRSGKFDDLSAIQNGDPKALMSKSVKPGARGRVKGSRIRKKKSKSTDVDDPDASVANPDPSSEV